MQLYPLARASPRRHLCPFRHEAAATHSPVDEPLRMQLAVRGFDCVPRNAQRLCKRPRGGQGPTDFQRAVQDQLPDRTLNAGVQRQGAMSRVTYPGFDRFELGVLEQLVGISPRNWYDCSYHFKAKIGHQQGLGDIDRSCLLLLRGPLWARASPGFIQ